MEVVLLSGSNSDVYGTRCVCVGGGEERKKRVAKSAHAMNSIKLYSSTSFSSEAVELLMSSTASQIDSFHSYIIGNHASCKQ